MGEIGLQKTQNGESFLGEKPLKIAHGLNFAPKIIFAIEALYKEPLGYIEEEELKSKKTIVHCCHSFLILESASLCPLEHFVFFPIFPFACELAIERWRIEVVEA